MSVFAWMALLLFVFVLGFAFNEWLYWLERKAHKFTHPDPENSDHIVFRCLRCDTVLGRLEWDKKTSVEFTGPLKVHCHVCRDMAVGTACCVGAEGQRVLLGTSKEV